MSLATADYKALAALSEERDALQSELDALNSKIDAALSGSPEPKANTVKVGVTKAVTPKANSVRGGIKGLITDSLKAANGATVKVTDLAKELGLKNQSVHVWFGTTGRKIAEIKKVGAGAYAWIGSSLSVPAEEKPVKKKKAKAAKADAAVSVTSEVEKPVESKPAKTVKSKRPKKASANRPF